MKTEVYIDGVKYIPAASVVANNNDFIRALLMEFYGTVKEDSELPKVMEGVTVLVNDWNEGVPISKIVNNLAEIAAKGDKEIMSSKLRDRQTRAEEIKDDE